MFHVKQKSKPSPKNVSRETQKRANIPKMFHVKHKFLFSILRARYRKKRKEYVIIVNKLKEFESYISKGEKR